METKVARELCFGRRGQASADSSCRAAERRGVARRSALRTMPSQRTLGERQSDVYSETNVTLSAAFASPLCRSLTRFCVWC